MKLIIILLFFLPLSLFSQTRWEKNVTRIEGIIKENKKSIEFEKQKIESFSLDSLLSPQKKERNISSSKKKIESLNSDNEFYGHILITYQKLVKKEKEEKAEYEKAKIAKEEEEKEEKLLKEAKEKREKDFKEFVIQKVQKVKAQTKESN